MRPASVDGERLVLVAEWGQVALAGGAASGQTTLLETLFLAAGVEPDGVLELAGRWQQQAGGALLAPVESSIAGKGPAGQVAIRLRRPAPKGSNLAEVTAGHGAMNEPVVAALVVDLLAAILAAHRQGLAVGGLGPEHLFVSPPGMDGAPALRCHDAGLAAMVAAAGQPPPQHGGRTFLHLYGPASVVAPEVLDGRAPTAASDIYALCATMAWLLLGRHVHEAADPLLMRHAAFAGAGGDVVALLHKQAPTLAGPAVAGLSTNPLLRAGVGEQIRAALETVLGAGQLRRLSAAAGGDPWAIGSPLIPLAAYAGAASYAERVADRVAPSAAAPGAEGGKKADLRQGMRQARLEAALAELEMRRALTDRRGAGRRVSVARLVVVLVTMALCAAIVWIGMRRSGVISSPVAPRAEVTQPVKPLVLPRRKTTSITVPMD